MTRILIIDDEPQIRKFLRISLASQDYEVLTAETGADGISQAVLASPDLVILDLGLPDMDGKHVLRQIISETTAPVIVLSVRSSEQEKVTALDMGAQDYVVKPFSVNELLARIRRSLIVLSNDSEQKLSFDNGNLLIDNTSHRVLINGRPASLTKKEWAVLWQLVSSPGHLITQAALLQRIWGKSHLEDSQYLRNVIQKLRQKLGDDASNPQYIETEPGVGYRFIPEN